MGIMKPLSSSLFTTIFDPKKYEKIDDKNPDPKKWEIIKTYSSNNFLIVLINYPNCSNYEGNKILVFEGVTLEKLVSQKLIDPHFSDNPKYISPLVRFEPTKRGWELAIQFINSVD